MNTRTRLIIGLTVVALGAGVVALGFVDQESAVRYVDDIADRPQEHATGTYTLLGMPQPPEVVTLDVQGPNPAYQDTLQTAVRWMEAGQIRISTLSTTVNTTDAGHHWSLHNATRDPSTGAIVSESTLHWNTTGHVFQIQGFPDKNGHQTTIWGIYDGVLRDPMQPKPSQFEGRVATHIDGVALPAGLIIYQADEYTAGCSSKFLPDDLQEEYEDDPDYA